jgi:long-chain acyl-CoA synthetase
MARGCVVVNGEIAVLAVADDGGPVLHRVAYRHPPCRALRQHVGLEAHASSYTISPGCAASGIGPTAADWPAVSGRESDSTLRISAWRQTNKPGSGPGSCRQPVGGKDRLTLALLPQTASGSFSLVVSYIIVSLQMDIVNTIALEANTDNRHCIHFSREGTVRSKPLAHLDHEAVLLAGYLRELGLGKGDRIGIMAKNCIEWVLLDLATLKLGGVTVGFEVNRFDAEVAIERYGLKRLFTDDWKVSSGRITPIGSIMAWDGIGRHLPALPMHEGYGVSDVCAIKFTSGSTGGPKGLEVTVGSINDTLSIVQEMFQHVDGDNILVPLRLELLQQRYWVYSALVFGHDVTVSDTQSALATAQSVHPTIVMGVPGFFDEVKRRVGSRGGGTPLSMSERYLEIQNVFGGRIRYLWTGSAPASLQILEFYNDCGVPLYQGYGLSETCIVAKNCPAANRIGSVGRILRNKTVRFDDRGVIVVGSRNPVSVRYSWCGPGDNERMFLPSGEVITQDMGYVDDDGYLYIRGRIDDIIVLSRGRNVLAAPIEARVKEHPGVRECVLFGHGRPFLIVLISPASPDVDRKELEAWIETLNLSLFPEQRIRGVVIAKDSFSVDNMMLTAQFKPVRAKIYHHLASDIDALYGE